jgi:hypothetical protein
MVNSQIYRVESRQHANFHQRFCACHVERLTVQHIYCASTVQSVEYATELYLQ